MVPPPPPPAYAVPAPPCAVVVLPDPGAYGWPNWFTRAGPDGRIELYRDWSLTPLPTIGRGEDNPHGELYLGK